MWQGTFIWASDHVVGSSYRCAVRAPARDRVAESFRQRPRTAEWALVSRVSTTATSTTTIRTNTAISSSPRSSKSAFPVTVFFQRANGEVSASSSLWVGSTTPGTTPSPTCFFSAAPRRKRQHLCLAGGPLEADSRSLP
ncbi:Cyclin-dependent kinase regulatory subunit [Carpediemonas membranifera]|uniref:Cyclin-dependent kinase regulatory subunit n=1 Tax=Carpediemonas membranifera TaxID=201153 RepID=A0A8J6E156_9EUKA|nr:Cyclin-dependent kinase regulatory subunit [Carpediemonas membranifera]|eukprot:KAG9390202.1 Cyclin-dependent kinase regulatory subunit [Carpediemonas membranifera]